MASRYDPPSPSILFCRSKLDERQSRSTFPTKNWRQRFGGLARRGALAVETNNSRNLVISSPIKPLRPPTVLLCKSWTISEYWQMRQRLPGTFPAGNIESAFCCPEQPKTRSRLFKNIFKSRFRVVPHFFSSRWLLRFWQIISSTSVRSLARPTHMIFQFHARYQFIWRHKSGLYRLFRAKDVSCVNS